MPEVLDLRSRRDQPDDLTLAAARCPSFAAPRATAPSLAPSDIPSTVFDRCWRQYALCREHLFTDHTRQIASELAPLLDGTRQRHLVEAGCGPGFYSRRLAARFPHLRVTGIDLSEPLLARAKDQARRSGLSNCAFLKADALSLAEFPNQIDAVVASRFFLILSEPAAALRAIFTALRPGGLCFIAEPASALRASLPLLLMRMTERLAGSPAPPEELPQSHVFSQQGLHDLVQSQPWIEVRVWKDRRYHCAVCRKAA
jgi:ubiquinone/menaquinone biosynthesis C-methylase UbiE